MRDTTELPLRILSPVDRFKRDIGIQKCKIPTFDALHPQILPYINLEKKYAEPLRRVGRIENGLLKLKMNHVSFATFRYIRRKEDYGFEMSDSIDLMQWNNNGKCN